ncbi:MAG: hypothetical protein K9G41_00990 [Flavobacteriales bacterium]|nr:hypothetical protein [Flavobacteriales bacterium]
MNLRIADWWNSKVAMLVGWSYFFVLLSDVEPNLYFKLLPVILIWLFSTAGFGYYVNDCFDVAIDEKASKPNYVSQHSKFKRFSISLFLAVVSLASALVLFWNQPYFIAIVGVQLILFVLYSASPFRWKEVPYIDVVTDSVYAQVIPVTIMALVIVSMQTSPPNSFQLLVYCLTGFWGVLSGLRNIVEHQVIDFQNDEISGVSNTVQLIGISNATAFLNKWIIPMEWLLFAAIIIYSGFHLPPLLILTALFVVTIGFTTPIAEGIIEKTRPFRLGSRLLEPRLIYEFWFPLACIMVLMLLNWKYLLLGILHLVLFRNWIAILIGDFMGNVVYYQTSDVLWHRGALRFYYQTKTVLSMLYGISKDVANRILTTIWAILVGFSYRLFHIIYFKGILELWIAFKLLVNYLAYQFKFRVLGDKEEQIRWKNRNGGNR